MKKHFLFIFLACFIGTAHATEMCANTDTIVIPLSNSASLTGYGKYDSTSGLAESKTTDINVWHIFTCLSEAEGGKSTVGSVLDANGKMLPPGDEIRGRIGNDADGNPRNHCWCKIIHPVSTPWYYARNLTGNKCNYDVCGRNCFYSVKSALSLVGM